MTSFRAGLRPTLIAGGLLSLALVGSACGGDADAAAAVTTVSSAQGLDLATAPSLSGEPVLTIKGKGLEGRFAGGLSLDIAALEQLRVVDAVVNDPWEKSTITYRGVLMSDLIDAVGPTGATALRLTALDDYEVTFPMAELTGGDAILATSIDGKRLAVEDGGPTKIVFLPSSVAGENKDLWIWSVAEMAAE